LSGGEREASEVTFHPGLAVSPVLLSVVLASGAFAESSQVIPTACQMRLTADGAVFKPIGDLAGEPGGPPGCGATDVVLLQRIILPDSTEVAVEPPATLRCEMATAITDFVRHDLAPAAAAMGAPLSAVENDASYDCRGRNGVARAKLSEHGMANALDIGSVRLKDGRMVRPADASAPREFRGAMKTAACGRFTTVLGPGSDGHHEDHIHLDLIERRSGYRMCQWDLHDEPRYALAGGVAVAGPATAVVRGSVPLPRPRPF
jgi:hypothetical protein